MWGTDSFCKAFIRCIFLSIAWERSVWGPGEERRKWVEALHKNRKGRVEGFAWVSGQSSLKAP